MGSAVGTSCLGWAGPSPGVVSASSEAEDRCLVSCVDGALHLCRVGEG